MADELQETDKDWLADAVGFLRAVYEPALLSGCPDRARLVQDTHVHVQRLGLAIAGAPDALRELFRYAEAMFLLGRLSVAAQGAEARQARSEKCGAKWSLLVTMTQMVLLQMGKKVANSDKAASQLQPRLEALTGKKLTLSEIRKALAEVKRQQSKLTH